MSDLSLAPTSDFCFSFPGFYLRIFGLFQRDSKVKADHNIKTEERKIDNFFIRYTRMKRVHSNTDTENGEDGRPSADAWLVRELQEQFKLVDLNKDGYIDAAELKKILINLGMPHSDEEVNTMIEQADVNGSGKIEEDDFIKIMQEYMNSEPEKEFNVRMMFDVFDSDKDGFISQQELQSALTEFLQETVSKKEIATMMKHACNKKGSQKSKSSMISFGDFQALLDDVGFSA